MTANTARFFENHHATDTHRPARTAVLAGAAGNAECRALAAGLIDLCMDTPPASQVAVQKLMRPLLERHFRVWPAQRPTQPGLTPGDTLKLWLYQGGNSRLVDSLALTLREIAAQTMEAHPGHFQEVFKRLRGHASTAPLHNPDVPLGGAALEALARVLALPVEHKYVAGAKTVHQRTLYPSDRHEPMIFLREDGEGLKVQLKHPTAFARLATPQTQTLSPAGIIAVRQMADIWKDIDTHNKGLLTTRNKTRHALEVMVETGELDEHALLALYIHARTLTREHLHAGTRHGSDSLFATLENSDKNTHAQTDLPHQLIEAIAREAGLGELSLDARFASMERHDPTLADSIQARP